MQALRAALAGDADVIQRLARVPTVVLTANEGDTAPAFAAQVLQLPAPVAAIYVTRTDPSRARVVQRLVEQADGPPVLTDEDATAIALTAAAMVYLRRLGRDPQRSRILIAAAIRMPILSPLLLAAGFPDITLWNIPDGAWFPLHRAARDADVVIDFSREDTLGDPAGTVGGGTVELDLDRPEGSVITRHRLDSRTLVAPGLLRAVAEHPAGALPFGLDVYQACADVVARALPPRPRARDPFPAGPIPAAAAQTVADAIAHAFHAALTRPETQGEWPSPQGRWRPSAG